MTCKDCIHYNSINATEGRCDKITYLGIVDVVDGEYKSCKEYEDKDGLYSDGTWHCPRCGVPVSKWGLCMDCEILYVTPKRKIVPVNLKIENISKHEFDFSDIEGIEDSWESVSK